MLRPIAAGLIAVLLAGCAGHPATATGPRNADTEESDRRILVMIADPGIDRLDLRGARSGVYRLSRAYPGTPAHVARVLRDVAADFRLKPVDGWPMRSLGIHCAVFEVEPGSSIDALIASLGADERIESVQRMQEFEVQDSGERGSWDDPYLSLQRSLEDSGITRAHRWSTGRGVRIAVIDTRIDVKHPDLRGQVIEVRNFISSDAGAPDRHGTGVAGVIASVAGNRRGIVGVAPGARILALQACTQRNAEGRGTCTSFSLARALDHAITADSDVLNLSLGGPRDPLLERLLDKAIELGMVVVAARGEDSRRPLFPANVRGVIAVGGARAPADVTRLIAPSHEVLTLVPPDGYDFLSGSSIAAAHVSGIVALLLERAPGMHSSEIELLLVRTSRPVARDGGANAGNVVSACDALAELSGGIHCGADGGTARAD
ncbi:MAG: S8 family peptidase, partial [Steroidobacteraceae bacterium]